MSKTQKEYDNVKKELEISMDIVRKTGNILNVGVTAILAWAVKTSNASLSLLSYCVIIPLYFTALDYNTQTMKLGTYLLVFHNDNWEKRLYKINRNKKLRRFVFSYRAPFTYSSIASTTLFFILLNYKPVNTLKIIEVVVCISLFLGFNAYAFYQKDNDTIKQKYIDAWLKIQEEEHRNKINKA